MLNLFLSHGSPMNAIAKTPFTNSLVEIGKQIKPKAIAVISAHWLTNRVTKVQCSEENNLFYSFGGFPKELYQVQYPTKGSPEFAKKIKEQIHSVELTQEWGLDHGAWSVLKHMYPLGDVPIFQISIDRAKTTAQHFEFAKKLSFLNDEGVLILGSGNVVHNLSVVDFQNPSFSPSESWAKDLNDAVNNAIENNEIDKLLNYYNLPGSKIGIASDDHYLPLIYALGASNKKQHKDWFYRGFELGTLSMDCIKFS